MTHPMKKDGVASHNDKLRRMTSEYGSASGSANNTAAPTNRFKQEGPERAIGFGADSTRPRGRADRAGRKQGVSNPVATLKSGGVAKRATGGRMKGKKHGGTHVNVIVAPQGGAGAPGAMARPVAAVPPMLPGAAPAAPAMPPRPPMAAGPMGAGPMPGGPPMAVGAPGGVPPGIIPPRAKGGRVHPDEAEDKQLIHRVLKNEGLVRSDKPAKVRAAGGRLPNQKHHMTAGAGSATGRLEKIGEKPKDAGRPQAV